ncbi:NADP-dependent malic enzyme [Candidatus Parcubacteria bacterium]|nr:NADP-dependent malic enzyme [Candidatus Parcubacteria bacterium]
MDYNKQALRLHKKYHGKIEINSKIPLKSKDDLSAAYTPGVGAVCNEIAKNKRKSWELTNRANQVAIVSDGTAILGLGNIGPEAGMPVMEGKSVIFKKFANVDALPLCINTTDTEEIIKFCKQIEPSFGGINLEDISAPRCFEILARLEKELNIPVFHDDQDGTAIVVLAGLINACRVTGKVLKELRIVISGMGAAGIAIARLLIAFGLKDLVLLDSKGIIGNNRKDLNKYKKEILAKIKNTKCHLGEKNKGTKEDAVVCADAYVGVSKPKQLTSDMIKKMNIEPIIFAMANPVPEIMPDDAKKAGAAIIATGRSDFDNQINNALVFPGIFRGLLDGETKKIDINLKKKIAIALAYSVKKPTKNKIIPSISERKVVKVISEAVRG